MEKFKKMIFIDLIGYMLAIICWLLIYIGCNIPNIMEIFFIVLVVIMNYTFFLLFYYLKYVVKGNNENNEE